MLIIDNELVNNIYIWWNLPIMGGSIPPLKQANCIPYMGKNV
jgi:hypothetical protein